MALSINIKPISLWIGSETKYPANSQFKQTYSNTKKILESELSKIGAIESSVQLEMFIRTEDLRRDGELRANSKPSKPGVVLSFSKVKRRVFDENSRQWKNDLQTLSYPCDSYNDWRDNLRAIALSLEALRKVARYGVFKYEDMIARLALPSASGKTSEIDSAIQFLSENSGMTAQEIAGELSIKAAYVEALHKLHPDKGGSNKDFHRLMEIRKILKI